MTPWESRPVVPPTVQVRIAAMQAAVAELPIAVEAGLRGLRPDEWAQDRAVEWEKWLWTVSDVSYRVDTGDRGGS